MGNHGTGHLGKMGSADLPRQHWGENWGKQWRVIHVKKWAVAHGEKTGGHTLSLWKHISGDIWEKWRVTPWKNGKSDLLRSSSMSFCRTLRRSSSVDARCADASPTASCALASVSARCTASARWQASRRSARSALTLFAARSPLTVRATADRSADRSASSDARSCERRCSSCTCA